MATLKEWCADVKASAQKMSDIELMRGIDTLDSKKPANSNQARAIELMKQIYEYELQLRLWEEV